MLIQCPECESKVSDKAVSCPHCGFPLQGEINPVQTTNKPKENAQYVISCRMVLEAYKS